jgi:hypothetical protein
MTKKERLAAEAAAAEKGKQTQSAEQE